MLRYFEASAFIKRFQVPPCKNKARSQKSAAWKVAFIRLNQVGTLISITVRNKFLLFINYPI